MMLRWERREESGRNYDAKVGEVERKMGGTMMLRWER